MQIVIWIVIILVAIFLIWLLKRWIRRIIFILILLVLAFFIYGIFNPSGAARLRYNVRTFPSRVTSWVSTGKEFLDYDSYKSKISSVGDSISDTIDNIGDKIDNVGDKVDLDIDDKDSGDLDIDKDEADVDYDEDYDDEKEYDSEDKQKESTKNTGKNIIKAFPKYVNFIELPELKQTTQQEVESENNETLPGYSRTDLLGIINRYLEKNLDDDTDILVTVEYDEDSADPQKIILQTQSKQGHSVLESDDLMGEIFAESDRKIPEEIEIIPVESNNSEVEDRQPIQKQEQVNKQVQTTTKKTTSTKLTEKEQKEAEEIFGILF